MKNVANKSLKASQLIIDRAELAGVKASIIAKAKGAHRRHSSLGSTFAPQKCVILSGIRMSIAQAKQYLSAREAV